MNSNPYISSWMGARQQYPIDPIHEYANLLDSNNFSENNKQYVTKYNYTITNILEIHSSNNIVASAYCLLN